MDILWISLSVWLHTLATVILVGHYLLMSLVYLPAFERQASGAALAALLEAISGRLRPFMGGSVLVFLVTGTYLMLINPSYAGVGNFGNAWSILIVVKHVVVLAMIALGIVSERVLLGRLADHGPETLGQLHLAFGTLTALGALILLLTAIAQAV